MILVEDSNLSSLGQGKAAAEQGSNIALILISLDAINLSDTKLRLDTERSVEVTGWKRRRAARC